MKNRKWGSKTNESLSMVSKLFPHMWKNLAAERFGVPSKVSTFLNLWGAGSCFTYLKSAFVFFLHILMSYPQFTCSRALFHSLLCYQSWERSLACSGHSIYICWVHQSINLHLCPFIHSFIYSFTHSLIRYLLSIYYVPDSVLAPGDKKGESEVVHFLMELMA